MAMGPACPRCGTIIPFVKTQWGLGTPFACRNCDASLVVPKNLWIGLTALLLFWSAQSRVEGAGATLVLLLTIAIALLAASWLLLKPRLVPVRADSAPSSPVDPVA